MAGRARILSLIILVSVVGGGGDRSCGVGFTDTAGTTYQTYSESGSSREV